MLVTSCDRLRSGLCCRGYFKEYYSSALLRCGSSVGMCQEGLLLKQPCQLITGFYRERRTVWEFVVCVVVFLKMARLKELADLGFVIAFRFYGRYPETGRSYYKPPCDTVRAAALDMSSLESDNNAARRSPPRRPAGLVTLVHSFSAPNFSEWISNGTDDISGTSLSGVLPSPMAQDVGAH